MSTEMIEYQENKLPQAPTPLSPFGSLDAFETAQRMAKALSASTFIPKEFRGNLGDCLILLETASRTGMPIMALLQNMYVVYGKPSFSSAFMAGMINNSNRFDSPLQFKYNDNRTACYAYATSNEQEYRSITVTMDMAKKEGWVSKKGSKWQTMPELMLQYRATSFFARAYCADLIMGMRSVDELEDIGNNNEYIDVKPVKAEELNSRFAVDTTTGEEVSEPNAQRPQPEPEKPQNVRTRPKVIQRFKEEIDAIESSQNLDVWRLKHQLRVERDLPKESDQVEVWEYAQSVYEQLKLAETPEQQQDETPQPTQEPEPVVHVKMVACPNNNGEEVHPDYCATSCGNREGCPVYASE